MSAVSENFRTFARYNAWANGLLFAACQHLSETEYKKPRPAFFGSLHATLNHILVGDRLWFDRFRGTPSSIATLDQELYGDLQSLWQARQQDDAAIIDFVDGVEAEGFERSVTYTTTAGTRHTDPLSLLLAHAFNHQTHHRGQVHDLLSQTDLEPPSIDLIYFVRQQE